MKDEEELVGKVPNVGRYLANLWINYRLRKEDFERLWQDQNGKCGSCEVQLGYPLEDKEQGVRLDIDHDHAAGEKKSDIVRVRGLLCHRCNWYIGQLEGRVLRGMVKYLEKWGNL